MGNRTGNGTGPINLAGHDNVMTMKILSNDSMAGPSHVCGLSVTFHYKVTGRSIAGQLYVCDRFLAGLWQVYGWLVTRWW